MNKQASNISATDAVWVVIPAAGVGKRMQSDIPKQYIKINNKTVIEHTLGCFKSHPAVAGIVVALHLEDPYWKSVSVNTSSIEIPIYTVEGGKERCDSVLQALDYLVTVEKLNLDHWVMVHDAARPCVSEKDINSLLSLRCNESIGGILATRVKDTMKRAKKDSHSISFTENRNDLWHALTPQMFRLGELQGALQSAIEAQAEITDEASAMERINKYPELVEGSPHNIKITQPGDIELAGWFLSHKNNVSNNKKNQKDNAK